MARVLSRGGRALGLFAALALLAAGCGRTGDQTRATEAKDKPVAQKGGDTEGHVHGEWWCGEHGLPEEVCDLCSKKYREQEKAKGNWCEHDRVKSSCFQCNPGLKAKYAAEYKAKYGEEPPPVEEEEEGKKDAGTAKDKK